MPSFWKKKIPGKKRGPVAVQIRECDRLWSALIRARDGGRCQNPRCFRPGNQPHHIFTRRHLSTRHDPENGILLCFYCHMEIAHREPEVFRQLILQILGERKFELLRLRAWSSCKFDYEMTKLILKELLATIPVAPTRTGGRSTTGRSVSPAAPPARPARKTVSIPPPGETPCSQADSVPPPAGHRTENTYGETTYRGIPPLLARSPAVRRTIAGDGHPIAGDGPASRSSCSPCSTPGPPTGGRNPENRLPVPSEMA